MKSEFMKRILIFLALLLTAYVSFSQSPIYGRLRVISGLYDNYYQNGTDTFKLGWRTDAFQLRYNTNKRFVDFIKSDSTVKIYNKLILESPNDTMLSVRGNAYVQDNFMGGSTTASATNNSFAWGDRCVTSGTNSFTSGAYNTLKGDYTSALGVGNMEGVEQFLVNDVQASPPQIIFESTVGDVTAKFPHNKKIYLEDYEDLKPYTTATIDSAFFDGTNTILVINEDLTYFASEWNYYVIIDSDETINVSGNTALGLRNRVGHDVIGSTVVGAYNYVNNYYAFASGYQTTASEPNSFSSGYSTTASNNSAFASGYYTTASGAYSFASGYSTTASSTSAFASGGSTTASGVYSFASGNSTTASGESSFASGQQTIANAKNSFAAGGLTTASGQNSFASGYQTTARGESSFASGLATTASADNSFASGTITTANSYSSAVFGQYNNSAISTNSTAWVTTDPLFQIGNGSSGDENDAFLVLKNSDTFIGDANGHDSPLLSVQPSLEYSVFTRKVIMQNPKDTMLSVRGNAITTGTHYFGMKGSYADESTMYVTDVSGGYSTVMFADKNESFITVNNPNTHTISIRGDSILFSNEVNDRAAYTINYLKTIKDKTYSIVENSTNNRFIDLNGSDSSTTVYNKLILKSPNDTMLSIRGGGMNVIDGSVLFSGTTGATPKSGAGTRLMWIPSKKAFRAGSVIGTEWDNDNIGAGSTAFGSRCVASGEYSFALGNVATASSNSSFASGQGSTASGQISFASNYYTTASGTASFASGRYTTANSYSSISLGAYNSVLSADAYSWFSTDPLLQIGNGSAGYENDAFRILKNGNTYIGDNSSTTDPILTVLATDSTSTFIGTISVEKSIKVGNDTTAASAANVGAIRYRADANNSYCEMVMQTGASTYAWVVIKQNTW